MPRSNKSFDPNIETCYIDYQDIGFGISMYICFSRGLCSPIGFVWGIGEGKGEHGKKNVFHVCGSYTLPMCRRRGVRWLIQKSILNTYDVVISKEGTKEGTAFMKAFGYKFNKDIDSWVYMKKKTTKR